MRKIKFAIGEYYHLYNRGVDKRIIFTDHAEYNRFLACIYALNNIEYRLDRMETRSMWEAKPPQKPMVAIGAYCLMPNHFHLYVTPLVEGGVSKFMQRVTTAYTMFFNEKHERSGALFQGTFKAEHVATEEYARYLFSYIHLNPAKLHDSRWKECGVKNFQLMRTYLHTYPYSSMKEYISSKHIIIRPEHFPAYLRTRKDINDHLNDWFTYKM